MLNKRKKYMDPTRINNYNKLLTKIDKNTTFPVFNYPISNSESEKKVESTINTIIDKLSRKKIDLNLY